MSNVHAASVFRLFVAEREMCVWKRGTHARFVAVFNLPLDLIEQWLVK